MLSVAVVVGSSVDEGGGEGSAGLGGGGLVIVVGV